MRKDILLIVVLLLVAGLAGCSPDASSIIISGQDGRNGLILSDTNTVELTAAAGDQVEIDPNEIVWSVSDPELASIAGQGQTVTVTGIKPGTVVVTAAYGELEGKYTLFIYESVPVKEVFREDFEGFEEGTPTVEGYTFEGNAVVATGEGGQGAKALKLTKTADNAEFHADFGQPLVNGSISLLIKKPTGTGTCNVSLAGAGERAGFQLTNNNKLRYRNTGGSVSSDTQIGTVDTSNWLRLEIVFDNNAGTYSFYQGEGRALIGGPVSYTKGDEGITGIEIVHQGNEGQVICIDEIVVTDLSVPDIVF